MSKQACEFGSWDDDVWTCDCCDKTYDRFAEREYNISRYYSGNKILCEECHEAMITLQSE